jgi:cysteinyl-tRNA synthetase
VQSLEKKCFDAINDDFNTPILIAHLFEGVKLINLAKNNKASLGEQDLILLKSIFDVFANEILGLKREKEASSNDFSNDIMDVLLKLRKHAKDNKDFTTADLIRNELDGLGIQIKDSRDGSSWQIKD